MSKNKKLFKRALWGYGANEVYAYLKELNDTLTLELQRKDVDIAKLVAQNAELSEYLAAAGQRVETSAMKKSPTVLKVMKTTPVAQKAPVEANTLISDAQKEADRIIEEATRTGLAKKQELQELIRKERVKLRVLQAEIAGLKKLVTNAIGKFEGDLEQLVEDE